MRCWAAGVLVFCLSDAVLGEEAPASTQDTAGLAVQPDAATQIPEDPCHMRRDREFLGLDWSRRELFRFLCGTARWFDGFFGEQRYDDSADSVRGRIAYNAERREHAGMNEEARFSVRLPLPNLNHRFNVFFERDDERRTLAGRTDAEPGAVAAVPGAQESTQAGVGFQLSDVLDQLLDLRLGARIRDKKVDVFARAKYRKEFAETVSTQWRFSQTLFHARFDGFGETTALDFEAKLSEANLLRWSNNATWTQATERLDWRTGVALYRTLAANRAVVAEVAASGASKSAVDIANYGVRAAYRQTLGRPWLLGEIYVGQDYPKSVPEVARDRQFLAGLTVEVLFGRVP